MRCISIQNELQPCADLMLIYDWPSGRKRFDCVAVVIDIKVQLTAVTHYNINSRVYHFTTLARFTLAKIAGRKLITTH